MPMLPITFALELPGFEITAVKPDKELISVSAFSTSPTAICPTCSQSNHRVHSYYQRHPDDLPWSGLALRLTLTVRRFFCDNPDCPRRTFAERLPQLLKPHAQKTKRLSQTMYEIAQESGGEAGSRLGKKLAIVGSPSTYLRTIRRVDLKPITAPRIIGIDDWAWRKRKSYGTIICDLESSEVLDLLPDCEVETVVAWLKQYPSIEMISRDRAKFFREAASLGAPQAIQIADRWHLLKNLLDSVKAVLSVFRSQLKIVEVSSEDFPAKSEESITPDLNSQKPDKQGNTGESLSELEKQAVRHTNVWKMRQAGASIAEIVRWTGKSRSTVFRDLASSEFKYRKRGGVGTQRTEQIRNRREKVLAASQEGLSVDEIVQRFGFGKRSVQRDLAEGRRVQSPSKTKSGRPHWKIVLKRLWEKGENDAQKLWKQLREKAYFVTFKTVQLNVQRLQAKLELFPKQEKVLRRYSPHQAAWLFVSNREDLRPQEQADLLDLLYAFPEAISLYALAQSFQTMVKEQEEFSLDHWLDLAARSEFPEFRSFANGLRKDETAVRASLIFKWSNELIAYYTSFAL